MFGKESALFMPSGTMSNLTALLTWCNGRGGEVILGDQSHLFLFEQAGACQFGGLALRTVPNLEDGTMDLSQLRAAIRDDDIHEPATKLIVIENTHNVCGGRILPLSFLESLREVAYKHELPIHMDGARIWNALTALNVLPEKMGRWVDSLSVCLSKGLGAPAGSLLVGPKDFIARARRIRKGLGGGMRQVGILAAAGLQALDDFESGILLKDHILAKRLKNVLAESPVFRVRNVVETNILFIDILQYNTSSKLMPEEKVSSIISALFKKSGILVSAWSPLVIRMVIHRDIGEEVVMRLLEFLSSLSTLGTE
jgi:threonine aldolase